MAYTSTGCVADRLAVGMGFAAWTWAWTLAALVAMSVASPLTVPGMDERRAVSAGLAEPDGALDNWAFSAMDWAIFLDCFVPNVFVNAVFCARIVS